MGDDLITQVASHIVTLLLIVAAAVASFYAPPAISIFAAPVFSLRKRD